MRLKRSAGKRAESCFQAGIHFRSDNKVALVLGQNVAEKILARIKADGADTNAQFLADK